MKPILPSRPNHSWLRRRLRDAISGFPPGAADYARASGMVKWSGQLRYSPRMNILDLNGRNAIVTGGAAGIGLAIAQRLAASGARMSLWDRDAKALEEAARPLGRRTHTATLDVSDEAQVKGAFEDTVKALGRVDVL